LEHKEETKPSSSFLLITTRFFLMWMKIDNKFLVWSGSKWYIHLYLQSMQPFKMLITMGGRNLVYLYLFFRYMFALTTIVGECKRFQRITSMCPIIFTIISNELHVFQLPKFMMFSMK
jgi:hypothetical protein